MPPYRQVYVWNGGEYPLRGVPGILRPGQKLSQGDSVITDGSIYTILSPTDLSDELSDGRFVHVLNRDTGTVYRIDPRVAPPMDPEMARVMHRVGQAAVVVSMMGVPNPAVVAARSAGSITVATENVASSAAQAAKLRTQLAAEEIATGHAYGKHVVQRGEFPGVTGTKPFAAEVERVMTNASEVRPLSGGRTAYWDSSTGTVVIRNPGAVDGGTAFKPTAGKAYFDALK